jgi:hypothetical protein
VCLVDDGLTYPEPRPTQCGAQTTLKSRSAPMRWRCVEENCWIGWFFPERTSYRVSSSPRPPFSHFARRAVSGWACYALEEGLKGVWVIRIQFPFSPRRAFFSGGPPDPGLVRSGICMDGKVGCYVVRSRAARLAVSRSSAEIEPFAPPCLKNKPKASLPWEQ